MALSRGDEHDILTHENPKHDCLRSFCTFDNCGQCGCADVKKATHCQHCYHCLGCSTAVSRGCRKCDYSPDPSKYRICSGGARGCDSADGVRDCSICYGATEWTKYLDDHPPSPSQLEMNICTVDWSEEDRLAADRAKIKEKNVHNHHAESHTPPGSPSK
jgi:hypothetical protein